MLLPEIEHECYTPVALARQALNVSEEPFKTERAKQGRQHFPYPHEPPHA
jgi:hypothetical protein